MKVGNLVNFFDYDYSAAHFGAKQRWRIGVVIDFWTPTKEEEREHNLSSRDTLAIIAHDGKTQWITMPKPGQEGMWVEILA
tara:strand:- start:224 stop:466 length:243 start_codon:yes stop_codon:yes gene_type:complete